MPETAVYIQGVETGVPPRSYSQDYAGRAMAELVGDTPAKRNFIERIYRHSAIDKRHSVVDDFALPPGERRLYPPSADYNPQPSTGARNRFYAQASRALTAQVAGKLLEGLPPDERQITHLISVTCTGFTAPGNDFHLVADLGLSPQVHRFNLGFMGCAAALPALKLARDICRSDPAAQVLVVNCELCSLHLKLAFAPGLQVANALFADGAAAALVSSRRPPPGRRTLRADRFAAEIIPQSAAEITWTIGDMGFEMHLSPRIPQLIQAHIGPAVRRILPDRKPGDPLLWALHPGGRAILDKFAEATGLERSALAHSYQVLRQWGNMSSATIMFVLQRYLQGQQTGPVFTAAFGPGLTLEAALLELA